LATAEPEPVASATVGRAIHAPPTASVTAEPAPPRIPGHADLDPRNDFEVAPPAVIENCDSLLTAAGVQFDRAELPVHRKRKNTFECGTPQAVRYRRGPGAIRYNSSPILSCPMVLALARFEIVIQEEAQRLLASRIRRIAHVGTYSCREMAQYPGWVSEHSYANALDIKEFELQNGRTISVLRHYIPSNGAVRDVKANEFLHVVLHRAYYGDFFSVALGPDFDSLHRDHFHLDQARYRANGTGS
jgi:hypothetical protein